jgi:hypothetical protein
LRWRHIGIIAERLLCSSAMDIRRYAIAKDQSRSLEDRQRSIVSSVINDTVLHRLKAGGRWKSPLALRNGLWSARKIAPLEAGRVPAPVTAATREGPA